jgi:hypothetical protein
MSENSKHFRLSAERLHEEMADSLDEELEMEIDDDRLASLLKDHIDKLRRSTVTFISTNCCDYNSNWSNCRSGCCIKNSRSSCCSRGAMPLVKVALSSESHSG